MKKVFKITVLMSCLIAGLIHGAQVRADEQKPASEINVQGVYLEMGLGGFVPVGNRYTAPTFGGNGDDIGKIGPGGGPMFAVGYDTKWAGIGTKLRFEPFKGGTPQGNKTGAIYSWDLVELKLYVLDWFRAEPSRLRPYLIAGGGFNINSSSILGAQAEFGAGAQYQLGERLYLGLEGNYRHLDFDETVPAVGGTASVGFRF